MVKQGTKQKLIVPHPATAQRTWVVSAKGVITGRFQTFIGFSYELPHTICIGFSAKHILKYSFLACWPLNTFFKGSGNVDVVILLLWMQQISQLPWLHILMGSLSSQCVHTAKQILGLHHPCTLSHKNYGSLLKSPAQNLNIIFGEANPACHTSPVNVAQPGLAPVAHPEIPQDHAASTIVKPHILGLISCISHIVSTAQ